MEPGTLTKVLNDFFTTKDGELSLNKGDYFLIFNNVDKHWCYGQSDKQTGKFPVSHLLKVNTPVVDESANLFISIASFSGEQPGDLPFAKGEIIVGRNEVQPGWYSGYTDSRKGIFPTTHVWELNKSIIKQPTKKKSIQRKAKVKTSMKAQLDEELDLIEGDIITVIELVEDGWCLGVTNDGQKGTFPEAFVTYIDDSNSFDETDEININPTLDPLPQSIQNGAHIYKDFGESSANSFSMNEPAPNYFDLFPENIPQNTESLSESQSASNCVDENPNPLGVEPYAITLYPFNAQFPNELSFESGEVVNLIKYIDSEWVEGVIDSVKGIFPVSYVNVIVDCIKMKEQETNAEDDTFPRQENIFEPEMSARVEYTFKAQMDGDLSIEEGDHVRIVEVVNADWIIVRSKEGKIGSCPSSYLTPLIESTSEGFGENFEDFVVIRNHEIDDVTEESKEVKRLSLPHRPAPPAPAPGRVPIQKSNIPDDDVVTEKEKRADKRQNVISELVLTEKEYVRDLKVTYETFNLHNPSFLESRGIDVSTLFGNIEDVTRVAEELLDLILRSMKDCEEEMQTVGPCFVEMAEKMQNAYVKYCTNHEAAQVLLQKYAENKDIMVVFDKGVETLRRQVVCFDMDSILIKPVQRILKYPLLLNELIKSTEDSHPDKATLEEAYNAMSNVAKNINESKRRKDLIAKYWETNNTLKDKFSKLTMHSVSKKSSRSMAMLSYSLGSTNLTPDNDYEDLTKQLKTLEICTKQLGRDVQQCVNFLNEEIICSEVLSELLNHYHQGTPNNEIYQLCETRAIIKNKFLQDLERTVETRVKKPLNTLITLLKGPEILITKRYHKMLDYDIAISKSEKYKDNRAVQEELSSAKNNFEALHQQLKEELPIFIEASTQILCHCINAFANARMLLSGRVMHKYMQLSQSANQVSLKNILESFMVNHNLLYNQMSRLKASSSSTSLDIDEGPNKLSPQSERLKVLLKNKYPLQKLFIVIENIEGASPLDLSAIKGTWVAVIKEKDPTGDVSKWFVDNGAKQGFIQSRCLKALRTMQQGNQNSTDGQNSTPDLISLESPVKESKLKTDRNSSQSNWYTNLESTSTNVNANYKNTVESGKFLYALYDFNGNQQATLSVVKGQALKLIAPHDQKGNEEWCLMENREGDRGYVPRNYMGPKELLLLMN